MASINLASDSIYFNLPIGGNQGNKYNRSLLFNTRLNQFESFTPHYDVPFMCNQFGEFLSLKNNGDQTEIWINNSGEYGYFYDRLDDGDNKVYEDSYIEYLMNPEPLTDKIFDTVQYRCDVFQDGNYMEWDTLSTLEVNNEFQSGTLIINPRDRKNPNIRKKHRIWNMSFPREEGTLNRIRNP